MINFIVDIVKDALSNIIAGSILFFWGWDKIKDLLDKDRYLLIIQWNVTSNENFIEKQNLSIGNDKKIRRMLESFFYNPSNIKKLRIKLKQKFFCNNLKFKTTINAVLSKTLKIQTYIRNGLEVIFSESFVQPYLSQYQTSITDFAFKYIQYVVSNKQANEEGLSYDVFIGEIGLCVKHKFSFDETVVKEFEACGPDTFINYKTSETDIENIMLGFIFTLSNKNEFFLDKEKQNLDKQVNRIVNILHWKIGLP